MHTQIPEPAFPGPLALVQIVKETIASTYGSANPVRRERLVKTLRRFDSLEDLADGRWYFHPLTRLVIFKNGERHTLDRNIVISPSKIEAFVRDTLDEEGLIILDRFGDPVPVGAVQGAFQRAAAKRNATPAARGSRSDHVFRAGPVPHTGGGGGWGYPFRYPKTTNERRQNLSDWQDGYFIPIRARRKNLVDAYDDPHRSRRGNSWKHHRAKQWKEKRSELGH